MTNTDPTKAYSTLVPFELGTNDYTVLAGLAVNTDTKDQSASVTSNVACVSCHRAHASAFESGTRLPERVDVVIETVGEATWAHSLRAVRPGGRIVVSGATSGMNPPADLSRVFFKQLEVVGSTMGTREELRQLWLNTSQSREQLAADLAAWCHRAEASGIAGLRDFSTRLRAARA